VSAVAPSPGSAAARERETARAGALDGIRGIACIAVLVYHAWLYKAGTPPFSARREGAFDATIHELRLGLTCFFVLSGFLLFTPWVKAALENRPAPRLRPYALRRVARIAPAYYLALLGSIALLWGRGDSPGVRLPEGDMLWTYFLFAQNFQESTLLKLDPPMWSLAVELMFYAALPLFGWLAMRRVWRNGRNGLLAVCAVMFAIGVAFNYWLAADDDLNAFVLSKQMPAFATYFAFGMLAAVLAYGRAISRGTTWALFGVGVVLVGLNAWWAADWGDIGDRRRWRDTAAAIGFAAIILAAWCTTGRSRFLTWTPFVWFGVISYGVYLWHVPFMVFLRSEDLLPSSTPGTVAVVLVPTLAVACLSWYRIEKPIQERARGRGRAPGPSTQERADPVRPAEPVGREAP
jgi:peptidoglycan/LPS O-acetylase OafA/YrhL